MTNERDSVRVAMEAILLLLYAWNSTPIPGTDISCCLVALGQEFQFPINFSADKHLELTSTPASITSYSRDLATHLSALREVATLLFDEQWAYHREFINTRRPDPKNYPSASPFLLVAQPNPTLDGGRLINLSIPSPVHGLLLPNWMVPPKKSSMWRQSGRTRSTHRTSLLILWN
jgi:hypothetical protein